MRLILIILLKVNFVVLNIVHEVFQYLNFHKAAVTRASGLQIIITLLYTVKVQRLSYLF